MSFIYFIIWQIKNNRPEDFGKAMIGFNKDLEHQLLNATSPFTFSEIPERSVFRFLKLVGCANLNIGNYTKLVDERNDIAHSNGNIFYADQKSVDEKIEEVLKIIGEIHFTSQCIASDCFKKFLTDSYDPDVREYAADLDQVREVLISKHFLSQKQIEICATFDIAALSSNPNYPQIKLLYEAFIKEYKSE